MEEWWRQGDEGCLFWAMKTISKSLPLGAVFLLILVSCRLCFFTQPALEPIKENISWLSVRGKGLGMRERERAHRDPTGWGSVQRPNWTNKSSVSWFSRGLFNEGRACLAMVGSAENPLWGKQRVKRGRRQRHLRPAHLSILWSGGVFSEALLRVALLFVYNFYSKKRNINSVLA